MNTKPIVKLKFKAMPEVHDPGDPGSNNYDIGYIEFAIGEQITPDADANKNKNKQTKGGKTGGTPIPIYKPYLRKGRVGKTNEGKDEDLLDPAEAIEKAAGKFGKDKYDIVEYYLVEKSAWPFFRKKMGKIKVVKFK